jgi:anhydro-N-acetylmuramic acid kinase
LIATAAALTAHSVYRHYRQFYAAEFAADEVIVSGGGVNNRAVMRRLTELFAPAKVMPIDALGVPADAKEAIAFAVLAYESWHGRPGNLPGATGARRRAVLGKLCWPLHCPEA